MSKLFHSQGHILRKLLEGIFEFDPYGVATRWPSDILADAANWLKEIDPDEFDKLESTLQAKEDERKSDEAQRKSNPPLEQNAHTHKLIEYTNLLHEHHDPNAEPVKDFLRKHGEKNPKFAERARKLNRLFES